MELIPEKKERIKGIIPKKYNSSNELIKELNNKSFIIIKQNFIGNLCNKNTNLNRIGMKYKFEPDSIIQKNKLICYKSYIKKI